VISEHPIKQILLDTQPHWDHEGTPAHVRENFLKIIKSGTLLWAQRFMRRKLSRSWCSIPVKRATLAARREQIQPLPAHPGGGQIVVVARLACRFRAGSGATGYGVGWAGVGARSSAGVGDGQSESVRIMGRA
jgi:hypothetical protein